ncbi:MAG: ankyrin repeat domain-containing protein, partial [Alphaproteobacteria bacterium]|nr:ankyrin repeat domain-containing protein [Alphaproteobacteria bacterium]
LAIANYAGEMPGVARALIEGGADANAVQDGFTPLMRAAIARNPDLARRLLQKGADPGRKDAQGRRAADFVPASDADLRKLLPK